MIDDKESATEVFLEFQKVSVRFDCPGPGEYEETVMLTEKLGPYASPEAALEEARSQRQVLLRRYYAEGRFPGDDPEDELHSLRESPFSLRFTIIPAT